MMVATLRVLAAILGVAGLGSFAVGCGSGGGAGVQRASATPSVSPQVKVYARAVNLRAADVPGMIEESAESSIGNGVPLGALDRCLGGLGRSELADAPILSAWFSASRTLHRAQGIAKAMTPPGERVYSEIDVMRDEALALREVAALGAPSTRVCLKDHPSTSHGAPPISHVEVYPLPGVLAGPPVTGLRMTGTLPPNGRHTSDAFSSDIIALASGRSVIVLHIIAWRRAFPVTTERRLLSLLMRRANGHRP